MMLATRQFNHPLRRPILIAVFSFVFECCFLIFSPYFLFFVVSVLLFSTTRVFLGGFLSFCLPIVLGLAGIGVDGLC